MNNYSTFITLQNASMMHKNVSRVRTRATWRISKHVWATNGRPIRRHGKKFGKSPRIILITRKIHIFQKVKKKRSSPNGRQLFSVTSFRDTWVNGIPACTGMTLVTVKGLRFGRRLASLTAQQLGSSGVSLPAR